MRRLSAHTATLAERLRTMHVHLTDHPLTADPTLYSTDGRHGSARSDAIADSPNPPHPLSPTSPGRPA